MTHLHGRLPLTWGQPPDCSAPLRAHKGAAGQSSSVRKAGALVQGQHQGELDREQEVASQSQAEKQMSELGRWSQVDELDLSPEPV